MTSINHVTKGKKMSQNSSKSNESLYSSSSSKYSALEIYGKTDVMRQASFLPATATADIRQRVLSARRLRVKSLQNQLSAAQHTINELANENRMLRTIHKRQDSALAKYEDANSGLPQILNSHAEEIRVWEAKYKKLYVYNKELLTKLKQKETIILNLSDENKHLTQLNKNKNLEERERLTEKLKLLEEQVAEKDKDIRLLTRRLQLEEKSYKTQLQQEHQRYRELQIKFENLKTKGNERRIHCDISEKNSKVSLLPSRVKSYKDIIREQNFTFNRKEATLKAHQHFNGNQSDKSSTSLKIDNTNNKTEIRSLPDHKMNIKNVLTNNNVNLKEVDFSKATKKGFAEFDLTEEEITSTSSKTRLENESNRSKHSTKNNKNEDKLENGYQYNDSFETEEDDEKESESSAENDGNSEASESDSLNVFIGGKKNKEDFAPDTQLSDSELSVRSKRDFAQIRQKICEDYKQKSSYLDSFCRQSIEETEQISQKHNSIDAQKKSKLLAALKDIDAENNDD